MLHFAHIALVYTLPFLAVLTLVVTVHEFGHFIVARLCGVAIDRFSIGFGRALVSWRDRGGVEWRIGWILLGGYVKFSGDENVASVPDAEDLAELKAEIVAREGAASLRRYFHFKPLWQRALVVLAGPFANFALATVIFAVLSLLFAQIVISPRVGEVMPGSPAAEAGFRPGDLILSANGKKIEDFSQVRELVVLHAGEAIRFDVQRGGAVDTLTATPVRRTSAMGGDRDVVGLGYLGIAASEAPADQHIVRRGPLRALVAGVRQTGDILNVSIDYLGRTLTGHETGSQISGILGMAGRTGQAATQATRAAPSFGVATLQLTLVLVQMAAMISVAVGFANLLPIPVLDGGHLLFYAYEAVARRPVAARVQAAGYQVGFALLVGLMLFSTWNDLQRFRVFHFIGGLFS